LVGKLRGRFAGTGETRNRSGHPHRQNQRAQRVNGYVPNGMTLDEAFALRVEKSDEYIDKSMHSMAVHVEAMLALQKERRDQRSIRKTTFARKRESRC